MFVSDLQDFWFSSEIHVTHAIIMRRYFVPLAPANSTDRFLFPHVPETSDSNQGFLYFRVAPRSKTNDSEEGVVKHARYTSLSADLPPSFRFPSLLGVYPVVSNDRSLVYLTIE